MCAEAQDCPNGPVEVGSSDPDHPYDEDAPQLEKVDYIEENYPVAIEVGEDHAAFMVAEHDRNPQCMWHDTEVGKQFAITSMGSTRKVYDKRLGRDLDCGDELDLFSDNKTFTVTRRSCHRQACPVCGSGWAKSQSIRTSLYLRTLAQFHGVKMYHCVIAPAKKVDMDVNGKLFAVEGREQLPVNLEAFGLALAKQFMVKFHDGTNGEKVGFAYWLHPGHEKVRGDDVWWWSPHVHLVTNFHFTPTDKGKWPDAMKAFCLEHNVMFVNKGHIDSRDRKQIVEDIMKKNCNMPHPKAVALAKTVRTFEKVTKYELGHSLLRFDKDGKEIRTPAVVYCGLFRPGLYDIERGHYRRLVCANSHPMVAVGVHKIQKTKTRVDMFFERVDGRLMLGDKPFWCKDPHMYLKRSVDYYKKFELRPPRVKVPPLPVKPFGNQLYPCQVEEQHVGSGVYVPVHDKLSDWDPDGDRKCWKVRMENMRVEIMMQLIDFSIKCKKAMRI